MVFGTPLMKFLAQISLSLGRGRGRTDPPLPSGLTSGMISVPSGYLMGVIG
tara:strand:+ start:1666 stop:1818 length:153 start_codon:yes stop_codon:yes gene_type:complete